ncbi:unnamed protein product, partial [Rotaria magnacalcarata]
PSLPSPTHSDRSTTSVPIHRTVPVSTIIPQHQHEQQQQQQQSPIPFVSNDDVHYATVNRKQINSDQHYDFPADA